MTIARTLLIADDSPMQAIMMRRTLVQAGFQVLTAKDGEEALAMLRQHPEVEMVISDVNMPKMNGYQFCHAVKNDPILQKLPVILCTVMSGAQDLIKGIEAGADNYVTRPYNADSLVALVKEVLNSPPHSIPTEKEEVTLKGQTYQISTSRQYILNFLLSTYQNVQQQNQELQNLREEIQKAYSQIESAQKEQEKVLLNIFPETVAQELIAYGTVNPLRFEEATVMFIDFVGFTKSTMTLTPQQLVEVLNFYFDQFDQIIENHRLERIKTIGDGYMCVGGLPIANSTHAVDCIAAAQDILKFTKDTAAEIKKKYKIDFHVRIGIHSGPVIAGVVGKKRFAYDIWGASVNLASRMESHGEPDKINISASTYEKVKDFFDAEPRGKVAIKNKEGLEQYIDMYFVTTIKSGVKI